MPSGKYQVRLAIGHDPKTGAARYKTQVCPNHKEATDALRRLQSQHLAGKIAITGRTNLGDFLDDWLERTVKPNRAESTYRQYEWIVREHIKPTLGKKPLDKVRRSDIQVLLSAKSTQQVASRGESTLEGESRPDRPTLSANTLRLIRAVLQSAYGDAKIDGRIAMNPTDAVEIPSMARNSRILREKGASWLPPEQAVKLAAACKGEELGDLALFMLHTGTRLGEASGVTWADIDFGKNPTVTIRGQLQRAKGNGLQIKGGTKTNQVRTLPLTSAALAILQERWFQKETSGIADADGIVFLTVLGNRIDPTHFRKRLLTICRKAGVPLISSHKLRHTAASLLLKETGDTHAVMKTLGHSQVALTANLYGHANAETLRPVVAKLDTLLAGDSPVRGADGVNPRE